MFVLPLNDLYAFVTRRAMSVRPLSSMSAGETSLLLTWRRLFATEPKSALKVYVLVLPISSLSRSAETRVSRTACKPVFY